MTDLKDFNKPDGSSTYLSETLDTVKGNINRVAVRDPQNATNVPVGFKKLEIVNGNLRILNHIGNGNWETFFDSVATAQAHANKTAYSPYKHAKFQYDREDFNSWIDIGYNPATIATAKRSGTFNLQVTEPGWVDMTFITPGAITTCWISHVKEIFSQVDPSWDDQKWIRVSGNSIPNDYKNDLYIVRTEVERLLLDQDINISIKRKIGNSNTKESLSPYRSPKSNVGQFEIFIPGVNIPGRRYVKYDMSTWDEKWKTGPVQDISYGDSSPCYFTTRRSHGMSMSVNIPIKPENFRMYLKKGNMQIIIPATDILIKGMKGRKIETDIFGKIAYDPYVHGGFPSGPGLVIISPLLNRKE